MVSTLRSAIVTVLQVLTECTPTFRGLADEPLIKEFKKTMVENQTEEQAEDDLFDEGVGQSYSTNSATFDEESDVPHGEVDYLHDVPVDMHAVVGAAKRSVQEILHLKTGSVLEFNKVVGEPMDVLVGGRLMCRGEIVVVNEHYGIRISEVIRAEDFEEPL